MWQREEAQVSECAFARVFKLSKPGLGERSFFNNQAREGSET